MIITATDTDALCELLTCMALTAASPFSNGAKISWAHPAEVGREVNVVLPNDATLPRSYEWYPNSAALYTLNFGVVPGSPGTALEPGIQQKTKMNDHVHTHVVTEARNMTHVSKDATMPKI